MTGRPLRLAKAKGLLDTLVIYGCSTVLDGERLIISGPRGALTPDDRRELADFKPEMVALLRGQEDRLNASRRQGAA